MTGKRTNRPLVAAVLAVIYPGLGHLYLGLLGRAVVWAATAMISAVLFFPEGAVALVRNDGLVALASALSPSTMFVLGSVTAMAAADAYWHASRGAATDRATYGPTCPECGKELDDDLEFCQWCTADLDAAAG